MTSYRLSYVSKFVTFMMQLLDAEILRFSHLRDRASDMGHRKEYPYLLNFF